ncbi:hypothetical protein I7I48_10051 [Histoplasma ohiense]|nr:hypothetical protein I7I48_10051 [Histoplasma ohiense (nom. inval.)]
MEAIHQTRSIILTTILHLTYTIDPLSIQYYHPINCQGPILPYIYEVCLEKNRLRLLTSGWGRSNRFPCFLALKAGYCGMFSGRMGAKR